jgi:hypothetical protein
VFRRSDRRLRTPIQFDPSGAHPAVDASGGRDLGNIDSFVPGDRFGTWILEGDWGRLLIMSPTVEVRLA